MLSLPQAFCRSCFKNHASWMRKMYRHNVLQPEFENFYLPFGGKLRSDNRWVRMAKMIPWDEIESEYAATFARNGMGAPALSARIAFGALIIKEMLSVSDEDTVEHIRENPYLQYFLGLSEYRDEAPFNPSMYVHFRQRLSPLMTKFNDCIIFTAKAYEKNNQNEVIPENDRNDDDKLQGGSTSGGNDDDVKTPSGTTEKNRGKLILDATCAPADISYPTDLKLLGEAREKLESIIDKLFEPLRGSGVEKPRTYREKARKQYLEASKSRRLAVKKLRRALGRQLSYVRRDLAAIDLLLTYPNVTLGLLSSYEYKCLLVIAELYRQQRQMYAKRNNQIDDRIVSISQPHVRPIVRGKAGAKVEFGAKIAAALHDGYVSFTHISWNSFNESSLLQDEIKDYHQRYGYWPESVHADKIYRNRENITYCKEHGIRLSGPPLGRPAKETDENRAELQAAKLAARQDELDRIPIEGKFGQGKRRFGLGRIMAKLADTSISAIIVSAVVMNLVHWLKSLFYAFFMVVEPDPIRHNGYFNALATLVAVGMAWIEPISASGNGIRRWHVMRFYV